MFLWNGEAAVNSLLFLQWGFQMRPTEALSIHHCLCPCTKELWVLLMHLLEHRHKALHRQVKTSTHLFAGAVKYECVHLPTDRSVLPLVFLELHEFTAEASGFGEPSSRAAQRPPHAVQGPAHVHVVAPRPRRHVGSVRSQRHSSDRGKKHNVIMKGFVECKYQHVVNGGYPQDVHIYAWKDSSNAFGGIYVFSCVSLYNSTPETAPILKPGCSSRINS